MKKAKQKSNWDNDAIQFPRLLAEIMSTVWISDTDWIALCETMDLTPDEVGELFERADAAWQKIKARAFRSRDRRNAKR